MNQEFPSADSTGRRKCRGRAATLAGSAAALVLGAGVGPVAHAATLESQDDNPDQLGVYYYTYEAPQSAFDLCEVYIRPGTPWTFKRLTGEGTPNPHPYFTRGFVAHGNSVNTEVTYITEVGGQLHLQQMNGPDLTATVAGAQPVRPTVGSTAPAAFIDRSTYGKGYLSDHIVYIGADDSQVHELVSKVSLVSDPPFLLGPTVGPWADDTNLDQMWMPTVSGPPIAHTAGAIEEIFYVGTDLKIYVLQRNLSSGGAWNLVPINTSGVLAGFFDSSKGVDALFYVASDRSFHELIVSGSLGWSNPQDIDLTRTGVVSWTGGPRAGFPLAAFVDPFSNVEQVFFQDDYPGDLHQLTQAHAQLRFYDTDLTTYLGGKRPAVGTDLATAASGFDQKDHLYYFGSDNSVQEYYGPSQSLGLTWVNESLLPPGAAPPYFW
jgi:hypothetical protein